MRLTLEFSPSLECFVLFGVLRYSPILCLSISRAVLQSKVTLAFRLSDQLIEIIAKIKIDCFNNLFIWAAASFILTRVEIEHASLN